MDWPPLLAVLGETERRDLLDRCRRLRFERGAVVVHEGDPARSLHIVIRGRLGVQVGSAIGDTAIINILGPGDYFGEVSLVDDHDPHRRTASVVALEPAETLAMTATTFNELRLRHPAVQNMVMSLLARRVDQLSTALIEALFSSLEERLVRRLAQLAGVYSSGEGRSVVIPLTQQQLADMVGGTRPTVNHILQTLQTSGVIAVGRGRITVYDPARLSPGR